MMPQSNSVGRHVYQPQHGGRSGKKRQFAQLTAGGDLTNNLERLARVLLQLLFRQPFPFRELSCPAVRDWEVLSV
jgi:hypothetical protein